MQFDVDLNFALDNMWNIFDPNHGFAIRFCIAVQCPTQRGACISSTAYVGISSTRKIGSAYIL